MKAVFFGRKIMQHETMDCIFSKCPGNEAASEQRHSIFGMEVRGRGEQHNCHCARKYHLAEIDGLLPPILHGAEYKQNGKSQYTRLRRLHSVRTSGRLIGTQTQTLRICFGRSKNSARSAFLRRYAPIRSGRANTITFLLRWSNSCYYNKNESASGNARRKIHD